MRIHGWTLLVAAIPLLLTTACTSLMSEFGLGSPSFPLSEPDYSGKRIRDLSPFSGALAAWTPERAAAMDALLDGATILDMQTQMDAGSFTSEELVTYYVDRIRRYDIDKLNSVMELAPGALDAARALDAERAAGAVRGPMHGIPVLLKDNIATGDGTHTTAGAWALRDWQADRDAFLVQRLRDAGAVILGKANLSEWANYMDPSMPNGFSTLGGQTRHPYGPFDPLGSSSGSAVSVAADLATVSVGTETQGSIIAPARSNSLVAIKPSRGLISRDYVIPLVDWMDTPGPMARNVTDAAILLTALAGVDANDPATRAAAALDGVDFTQYAQPSAAAGLRIGYFVWNDASIDAYLQSLADRFPSLTQEQLDPIGNALREQNADQRGLADLFQQAGVEFVEISSDRMPSEPDVLAILNYGFRDSVDRFFSTLGDDAPLTGLAEVAALNDEDAANRAPYGQAFLAGSVASTTTAQEYAALVAAGDEAAAALRALLTEYGVDLLLVNELTQVYAPAGFPAITVPSGYTDGGQPTGIVLAGDYLSEPDLIAAAFAYEQATRVRRPPELDRVTESFENASSAKPAVK